MRLATRAAAAVAVLLAFGGATPASAGAQPGPKLAARAWFLEDARTGEPLAAHAASRELAMASATKLMTAHLALERLPQRQRIAARAYRALPAESILGLRAGERISVRDLLYALVMASANDAAVALADAVAGSVPRFVRQMNRAAQALGLIHTHYSNPIGLDEIGNYSSARDLVALARELLRNPTFRRIADTERKVLRTGARPRTILTRNTLLLKDPSATGVKTGHTLDADYVLVASASRRGVDLISAVMGAPSESARDSQTEELLRYGFSLYRTRRPVIEGKALARPAVRYRDERLPLIAARTVELGARRGQRIDTLVEAPGEVDGPIRRGLRLGRVVVSVDGRRAASVPLVAARSVSKATAVDKVRDRLANPVLLVLGGTFVIVIGVALARRGRPRPRPASGPSARTAEERMKSEQERTRRRGGGRPR